MNKSCSVEGCDRSYYAKSFCQFHYQRVWLTGTPHKKVWPTTCKIDGCDAKRKALGLCLKHYTRQLKHGTTEAGIIVGDDRIRLKRSAKENENGCWIWQKSTKLGYGITFLNGRHEQAHRASWKVFVGEIESGKQINHKCHVRNCINPSHLYIGDQVENMRDMKEAGREKKAFGERNGMAILTAEKVMLIRTSKFTRKELAAMFDCSLSLISAVKNNKIWRHVQ